MYLYREYFKAKVYTNTDSWVKRHLIMIRGSGHLIVRVQSSGPRGCLLLGAPCDSISRCVVLRCVLRSVQGLLYGGIPNDKAAVFLLGTQIIR